MPPPLPTTLRWYALPLVTLGAMGFSAAWLLLALATGSQCAWLAPLAAIDMWLLLRISHCRASMRRALTSALATLLIIFCANFLIAAAYMGMHFGLRPWESALKLGPSYAWLLSMLANDRIDIAFYLAGLVVALWTGLSGRRPMLSTR